MFDPTTNQQILLIISVIFFIFSVFYFLGSRGSRPLRYKFKKDKRESLVTVLDLLCGGFLFTLSNYFFGLKYTILYSMPFAFILSYTCKKIDDWREKRIKKLLKVSSPE